MENYLEKTCVTLIEPDIMHIMNLHHKGCHFELSVQSQTTALLIMLDSIIIRTGVGKHYHHFSVKESEVCL